MNRKEFIENLATAGNFNKEVAEGVYKVFIETLKISLLSGGSKVVLPELGKFEVKIRKARDGVNPNTGEKMRIPEKKTILFKLAKNLAEKINSSN